MTAPPLSVWRAADPARLLDQIPSGVVVLDQSLRVIDHNRAFAEIFGEGRGLSCFQVALGRREECPDCPARATFKDGRPRAIEQIGRDRLGREAHFLVNITAMRDEAGSTPYVAAVITDLTATKRLQREYQTLFEKVPCFVAVINRDYRVVKANEAFRQTFGEPTGERCYALYKRRGQPCSDCPVDHTFADGGCHTSREDGVSRTGDPTPYLISTAPLLEDDGEVTHVLEMALDMTEHDHLEEQLGRATALREALVTSSPDAILVLDEEQRIVMANRAAEELLERTGPQLIGRRLPRRLVPDTLHAVLDGEQSDALLSDGEVPRRSGEAVPVHLAAFRLVAQGRFVGSVVIARDLTEVRRLQREVDALADR